MTDQEKMTRVLSDIMTITDIDCLERIQSGVFSFRNSLRQTKANINTLSWKVGDDIQMLSEHQSRKPYGVKDKIVKINKVKFKCDFGGKIWNVPKSMLQKAV